MKNNIRKGWHCLDNDPGVPNNTTIPLFVCVFLIVIPFELTYINTVRLAPNSSMNGLEILSSLDSSTVQNCDLLALWGGCTVLKRMLYGHLVL